MSFNEYLLTVAVAGTIGIISDIVNSTYSERIKGLSGYIKFGTAVCVVSCIVLPILTMWKNGVADGFLKEIPQITASDYTGDSLYILEKECEERLRAEIHEKCGINLINAEIKISFDGEKTRIDKVTITVDNLPTEKRDCLARAVRDALGTDAFETIYKG